MPAHPLQERLNGETTGSSRPVINRKNAQAPLLVWMEEEERRLIEDLKRHAQLVVCPLQIWQKQATLQRASLHAYPFNPLQPKYRRYPCMPSVFI